MKANSDQKNLLHLTCTLFSPRETFIYFTPFGKEPKAEENSGEVDCGQNI